MRRHTRHYLPLARKVCLLFGTSVLLTIIVTLAFPWMQMGFLNKQALLVDAKRIATVAGLSVDLQQPDWQHLQDELYRVWPVRARAFDVPAQVPRLIPVGTEGPGFQRSAVDHLSRFPQQLYYWDIQRDRRVFRLAMAVRSTDFGPHPTVLVGIVDVALMIRPSSIAWNTVITGLAGASGAVLAILAFYMVTQRLVLSKLKTLRDVAERVTDGDIEVQSEIASGDEFEDLSDTLNNMLSHLRTAQEEQRKINRSLDIRLGELAQTNVDLYEANRVKTDFLSNVSHELRTPLVSIIGFAELLRDAWKAENVNRQRLARYSENILTSGRNLLDLINDLLDLAKIEAGKMQIHRARFAIGDLCRDLIDFVEPLADKRQQKVHLLLDEDLPEFHSDAGKIKQILYNLLSNAIKFTPHEGSISLQVTRAGDAMVKLIVSDSGPGIAEEDQKAIFEKFHQLDGSRTREYEGTGLGLAITRELAMILGGAIALNSEPGQGATFTVTLPSTAKEQTAPPPLRL